MEKPTKKRKKWSKEDTDYIRNNIALGAKYLALHFDVSEAALRKQVITLNLSLMDAKNEAKLNQKGSVIKENNNVKFDKSTHKIKNGDVTGKIPFYIASERMTVYLSKENNTKAYKEALLEKYANRHKTI